MSDFNNLTWSIYVAVLTVVSIVACLALLWATARKKTAATADNTTGHVWDGDLREMNNPLPRWWMWLFVLTIVFSLGYLALYPGLGRYEGMADWSTRSQYEDEVAAARKALEPMNARYAAMAVPAIAQDAAAMGMAERLFMNNCSQCHGSDAHGAKGFPNLTDRDWLHGGSPEKIIETITIGRTGTMPPMAAAIGGPEDVRNVAHYVLSLSSSPHDAARAELGKAKFMVCAACHGMDGKGNQTIGAPNLTDDVWLHGAGEAAIIAMIDKGKTNQMPAQSGKLSDTQIRLLAAYVWKFSNQDEAGR